MNKSFILIAWWISFADIYGQFSCLLVFLIDVAYQLHENDVCACTN